MNHLKGHPGDRLRRWPRRRSRSSRRRPANAAPRRARRTWRSVGGLGVRAAQSGRSRPSTPPLSGQASTTPTWSSPVGLTRRTTPTAIGRQCNSAGAESRTCRADATCARQGRGIDWIPGGGLYSHSVSPEFKVGLALTGNFGSVVKYDDGRVGLRAQEQRTLLGLSILPSVAWPVNENLPSGARPQRDGRQVRKCRSTTSSGPMADLRARRQSVGFRADLGLLYEVNQGTRFGITYTSPVKLDFSAQPQWSDLGTRNSGPARLAGAARCERRSRRHGAAGRERELLHEIDPRWAVLGGVSAQWSKFGEVAVGVDSNNPIGLTTRLDFKDTWHVAGGAQYKWSDKWLLNAGIAYDSAFQDNNAAALGCLLVAGALVATEPAAAQPKGGYETPPSRARLSLRPCCSAGPAPHRGRAVALMASSGASSSSRDSASSRSRV